MTIDVLVAKDGTRNAWLETITLLSGTVYDRVKSRSQALKESAISTRILAAVSRGPGTRLGPYEIAAQRGTGGWAKSTKPTTLDHVQPV